MEDIDDDDVETTTPSSSYAGSSFEESEASPEHFSELDAPCTPPCVPSSLLSQKAALAVTP
eukprot:3692108-Amphidinium_carterae.1